MLAGALSEDAAPVPLVFSLILQLSCGNASSGGSGLLIRRGDAKIASFSCHTSNVFYQRGLNNEQSLVLSLGATVFSLVALSRLSAQAQLVTNGSFKSVQIGSPFNSVNSSDTPGWTHTGNAEAALLWEVGYSDSGGRPPL